MLARPVKTRKRKQRFRLCVETVVVLDDGHGESVQVHQGSGNTGAIRFVLGVFCKSSGAHIETFVVFVATAKEAPDLVRSHLALAVLHFDDNARRFEAKAVGRGNDVSSSIRTWRGDLR